MLLQGTRPRFASDTLMSRRNIPASPLLIPSPSPGRWSSGCGCTVWNDPRALGLGRVCAEAGRGILGLGTADSSPGNGIGIWVRWWLSLGGQGAYQRAQRERACRNCASAVPLYLPAATSGCPSSARAGPLQERRKCIARQPIPYTSEEHTPQATPKHLKNVQLTPQLC